MWINGAPFFKQSFELKIKGNLIQKAAAEENPHTVLRRGEALHGLFDAETGDAKREAVPAIEHIEQMCQTMH
ncbi:MAG: hypothetical protein WCH98_06610 [Verrucomicrobiota bacterium]